MALAARAPRRASEGTTPLEAFPTDMRRHCSGGPAGRPRANLQCAPQSRNRTCCRQNTAGPAF
eukprot:1033854-Prorocentrum_lima.AAC.1